MARLTKGIFGGFSGKLGGLVGYTLNGKETVRTKGTSSKPPSPKQLTVRQKIKLTNMVLKPMLPVINIGFSLAVKGSDKNPFNEAVSYNFHHACTGSYPNIGIDYSKLLVSRGTLPTAYEVSVSIQPGGLEFTWSLDPMNKENILNDRAMLLICYLGADNLPLPNESVIYVLIGAQRGACSDFIALAPAYLSRPMVCYLSFQAEDGKSISDSVMAGRF